MGIIHAGVEDVDLGMLSQGRRMASRARETDGNPSHVSSGGGMYVFFGAYPAASFPPIRALGLGSRRSFLPTEKGRYHFHR